MVFLSTVVMCIAALILNYVGYPDHGIWVLVFSPTTFAIAGLVDITNRREKEKKAELFKIGEVIGHVTALQLMAWADNLPHTTKKTPLELHLLDTLRTMENMAKEIRKDAQTS